MAIKASSLHTGTGSALKSVKSNQAQSDPEPNHNGTTAPPITVSKEVTPLSTAEILDGLPSREFIILAGKDGVGKTCSILSMATYVETVLAPDAKFYVIDTENKFRTAMKSFGPDCPSNIVYYKTDDMNQCTWALDQILRQHNPGDWLAVESMSRVWERAQDLGYSAISGFAKAEYMERRRAEKADGGKAPAVTPQPDQLWSITKGAHDGAFVDRITMTEDLNVILSTTLARPPKEGNFMKESADRKALRVELGIDAGLDGAPRLPYYCESLMILDLKNGKVTCRVLRDNINTGDETRGEFAVEGKKTFAINFWESCRG